MNTTITAINYSVLFALMVGLVTGCSRKQPSTNDVKSSVSQTLSGYSIKDINCESFADKTQEAAGRSSCRGNLTLDENLYAMLPPEDVQAALISAGVPREGVEFFRNRHPRQFFAPPVNRGTETPFTAECGYSGVAGGWGISCNTSFSRFSGQPLASLGGQALAKDSPEYNEYIKEVVADFSQLDTAYKELMAQVENFFTVGRTVYTPPGGETIRAKITAPLTWFGEPGFLGRADKFSTVTKYQDLRQNTTGTFCGYPIGTPRDDILFSGYIITNRDRNGGFEKVPFGAKVEMINRSSTYQNQFSGCAAMLTWNGTAWQAQYNNFELKAE